MKKVIILVIGAIFVMSVVLISMFGMEMVSFNETVYATRVEFVNLGITEQDMDGKAIKVLRINYEYDGMEYRLAWKVYPEETTNNSVRFSLALPEEDTRVAVSNKSTELGILKINTYIRAFTVYITAQDGTNVKDQLYVVMVRQ